MEKISQFNIGHEGGNYRPRRNEENLINRIDAQKKLKELIEFSDEKGKDKDIQQIIWATRQYVERLSGVDEKKARELQELIDAVEVKFHKDRFGKVKSWKTFK